MTAPARTVTYADLDGTIVRSDTTWETAVALLRTRPLRLLSAVVALRHGRASCKRLLAGGARIDAASLPYDEEVVAYLRDRRASGHDVVIATAAVGATARAVAAHLGFVTDVIATGDAHDRARHAKTAAVLAHAAGRPFEYVGDGDDPDALWRAAAVGHVVGSARVAARVARLTAVGRTFLRHRATPEAVAALLRTPQWLKNVLVFVPLALSHRIAEPRPLLAAALAFVSFSLAASAVYVMNDLWDLPSDRAHRSKRARPLAAGAIRMPDALAAAALAITASFAVGAALLPRPFLAALVAYVLLTAAYTMRVKRVPMLDVVVLAACYACRIVAGGAASGVRPSGWLIVFSLFFFLSLALLKRYSEIAGAAAGDRIAGRGYVARDLDTVRALGIATGVAALFVMALYVTNPQVTVLYARPTALWLVVLAATYWLGRMWIQAGRGNAADDPFAYAVGDRVSWAAAAFMGAVLMFAA